MAAKRDVIRQLRAEIKTLEEKVKGQADHLHYMETKYVRAKKAIVHTREMFNRHSKQIALSMRTVLDEELMWQELASDPSSKITKMSRLIYRIETLAE